MIVKNKEKEYECLIDEDKWHDLTFLCSWHCHYKGYVYGFINGKKKPLHRYLYEKYKPSLLLEDKVIDHITGKDTFLQKLDNRMSNLRIANYRQNSYNRNVKNKTGYRGVKKDKYNKYCAYIRFEEKYFSKQGFETAEEAAIEYNKLAIQYYGEFAVLNKIIYETFMFWWFDD
jgi:hypothetical protein